LLGDKLNKHSIALGELTIECDPENYLEICQQLRDTKGLQFEQLIDLCGVDYQEYGDGLHEGPRFAVVNHFLSIALNQRLRLKVFVQNDDFPILPTLVNLWPEANWFEREAFDFY
jgi:NADH-quinone oxidoreductase subunit C